MGLKNTLQRAVSGAFDALGDIKFVGVFYSSNAGYNPSSGAVSNTEVKYRVHTIRSLFGKYEDTKSDSAPRHGDFKLLVLAREIPNPKLIDKVQIDGVDFNIIGFTIDPADAMYVFHTRGIQ